MDEMEWIGWTKHTYTNFERQIIMLALCILSGVALGPTGAAVGARVDVTTITTLHNSRQHGAVGRGRD